jgi:cytochrome c551/c552
MCSCPERAAWHGGSRLAARLALLVLALSTAVAQAQSIAYPNVGRAATPKEVQAWDIDVRPDFKGLPAGSGSVARGMQVWEGKCASCHGVFGESNEVFSPIVGGTTADDVRTGRVARLNDASFPGRTTLMKVSSVSTLWDYIRRAMPWAQPKSLTVDEVYAVTAFILHLGGVVADDFTLSERNIAQVQQRLPNRNGMSTDHGLWPGRSLGHGKPDVRATACMKDCAPEPTLASFLPDFARDAHGNLAEQNRVVGAQVGADTSRPASVAAGVSRSGAGGTAAVSAGGAAAEAALALSRKHVCVACHAVDAKLVGPSFHDVARKYDGRADAVAYLAGKIRAGGAGVWGAAPMPPQSLPEADAKAIAQWLADGARQ